MTNNDRISADELSQLKTSLAPLLGVQFDFLKLPVISLSAFEPSQIGTICGTLMDAAIPFLGVEQMPDLGLTKHEGILGEREGYPDYLHSSGKRAELKLLYIDNPKFKMKRPPTAREPSARLTQKVTVKNVEPARDAVLLLAYQLRVSKTDPSVVSPTVVDLELFSAIELVESRDKRLLDAGGRWFGNYETPAIISRAGKAKISRGEALNTATYGRKESEGHDFNEDTNFGKMKRIPHRGLQAFLAKCRRAAVNPDETDRLLAE